MKFLVDCSNIRTGGAIQNGVSLLANAAADSTHEWSAIVSGELAEQIPKEWESGFYAFHRLNRKTSAFDAITQARSASLFEKKCRPQLVYTLFGPAYWNARSIHVVGFAKPQFLYPEVFHRFQKRLDPTSIVSNLKLAYQRRLFRKADYLIAETGTVRERAVAAVGFPLDSFFTISNGYSPVFSELVSKIKARSEDEHVFKVFIPTSYYQHKNLEVLPKVAVHLSRLIAAPFEFQITLSKSDAKVRKIVEEAELLGVGDRMSWLGPVKQADLAEFYMGAGSVFLPTLMECSTSVYPECFLSNTPLVTSDRDFARELCRDAALYCDPLDAEACARALAHVWNNPETRSALALAGQSALRENYLSPKARWNTLISLLERCVIQRQGRQSVQARRTY